MNSSKITKYRPYLTLAQLTHLQEVCTDIQTKEVLTKFIYEISKGWKSPQLSLSLSLQTQKEQLEKVKEEQTQRYLNNEMTPEEEAEYEKQNGIIFSSQN